MLLLHSSHQPSPPSIKTSTTRPPPEAPSPPDPLPATQNGEKRPRLGGSTYRSRKSLKHKMIIIIIAAILRVHCHVYCNGHCNGAIALVEKHEPKRILGKCVHNNVYFCDSTEVNSYISICYDGVWLLFKYIKNYENLEIK